MVERLNGMRFTEADVQQILAAMRRARQSAPAPAPVDVAQARADLQRALAAGEMSLAAFTREWRRLEAPQPLQGPSALPDELRLRRGRKLLDGFGDLWADPAVPDQLREDAVHELFTRIDVDGPDVVALHPQENENAWLLGYAAMRDGSLTTQRQMGMVGARGVAPPRPT